MAGCRYNPTEWREWHHNANYCSAVWQQCPGYQHGCSQILATGERYRLHLACTAWCTEGTVQSTGWECAGGPDSGSRWGGYWQWTRQAQYAMCVYNVHYNHNTLPHCVSLQKIWLFWSGYRLIWVAAWQPNNVHRGLSITMSNGP